MTRHRRQLRRIGRNRLGVVGLVLLALLALFVSVGPLVWNVDPMYQDLSNRTAGRSAYNPLGTDTRGRDMLALLMAGARTSLLIAVVAIALSTLVGGAVGLLAGVRGGWLDAVLMRAMDVLLCFPALLLAISISAVSGPGILTTALAVAVPAVPLTARLLRSSVMSVRTTDFVTAAVASGTRRRRVTLRHVLPNAVTPTLVQACLGVGLAVQTVAALGFLGLGVERSQPELGAILTDALTYLTQRPELLVAPGLTIAVAVVGFTLAGDVVRDWLDVRA